MAGSNKMISSFADKPKTQSFADAIMRYTESLGETNKELKAQVSFSVNRKFLWLWAYEQTPDGTLFLNVTLAREIENAHIHNVTQTSKNRWNHHVVVKSDADATSDWLRSLIRAGYKFACKNR